jgi:large subunit ribosomal protein L25
MPEINAEIRELSLKPAAAKAAGLILAEIYGRGFENKHIAVPAKEFGKVFAEAGENTIVDLKVAGETFPVIIHDYQKNAVSDEFMSIDFFKVKLDEKIIVPIPLEFTGESLAVKEMGGVLVKSMDEIEVEAFPSDLPHSIKIDISAITEMDGSIFVKDLAVSGKYEIKTDPGTVIATVTMTEEEEIEVAPASVEDVVTEGEAKRAEAAAEAESEEA